MEKMLIAIDLRWGVDTSELENDKGAAKVLSVCLNEIEKSHPYMLIFLGQRYGWIPDGKLIENAIKDRQDKYTTDDFEKSVTALEIEYGALSKRYGDLENCIVCMREPLNCDLDEAVQKIYFEQEEKGKNKLDALKDKIRAQVGARNLITYSATWDADRQKLDNFMVGDKNLEDTLVARYLEMFQEDWSQCEYIDGQDREKLNYRALMEEKCRTFVGFEETLEEYYQTILNADVPVILQGESGSGKTAIMCKIIERLEAEGKKVFYFFAGAGSRSVTSERLALQIKGFMQELSFMDCWFGEIINEDLLDEDSTEEEIAIVEAQKMYKPVHYKQRMEYIADLVLSLPKEEKVYCFIDAIDQLYFDEHVKNLDFLLAGEQVQMILSCTDTFELPEETMVQRIIKEIPVLDETGTKQVINAILKANSRNSYAQIEQEMLKKKQKGNPLYLSFLIQRLNMMDAEELKAASTEAESVARGTEIMRNMPDTLEEAAVCIIKNAIDKITNHGKSLLEALRYIAVSANGLRLQDLQILSVAKGERFQMLDFSLLQKYLNTFFYVYEDGRFNFLHKVIRNGLLLELENRSSYEHNLKDYLKKLDKKDVLRIQEGMHFARICNDYEFAKQLLEQAYETQDVELIEVIKSEAVADKGSFYNAVLDREEAEEIKAFVKNLLECM